MYKVGQRASRTSQLPVSFVRSSAPLTLQRANLTSCLSSSTSSTSGSTLCKTSAQSLANDIVFTNDVPCTISRKKKRLSVGTPPTTPSSPLLEQQLTTLNNSWRAFREKPTGEPDDKIVEYRPANESTPAQVDFTPFDIDQFLMEKLLREVDIDPKIIQRY